MPEVAHAQDCNCPECCPGAAEAAPIAATDDEPKVELSELPVYHSNPGAPNVFYLDFDGQLVSNTDWNRNNRTGQGNNGNDIHAPAYDTDGDRTTFSQTELDAIYEIWQRVSEDFIPFDINVTTEEPPPSAFKGGRGAARVIISTNVDEEALGGTGNVWAKGVGGIAFSASYWWDGDTPAWVFHNQIPRTPKAIAEAASHEFGHVLGLEHAGKSGREYHAGTGEGETSWAPIMGTGYSSNVTQWTDGSYDGGVPTDNFETMTGILFQINFREDDHGQTKSDATQLVPESGRVTGSGIIETNTDLDAFSFEHPGGLVDVLVSPAAVGPNLDIAVQLYDANSDEPVAEFAPNDVLAATVVAELPAGTYYLLIDGGGNSSATGEGYSQYGSVGTYHIEGVLGAAPLMALPGDGYAIDEGQALALNGDATGQPTEFAWDIDGDGEFDDATGPAPILSWETLQSLDLPIRDQGEFAIAMRVTDAFGNVADAVTTLVVRNVAPILLLNLPEEVRAGEPIELAASADDVTSDILTYDWDFGDGSEPILATTGLVIHTFAASGSYVLKVTVRDDDGAITTTTTQVDVVETPLPATFDFSDFLAMSANFGASGVSAANGDFDGDGVVTFEDFLLLARNFGTIEEPAPAQSLSSRRSRLR